MEIYNTTLFFVGITLSIVGSFVIIFDYPQIQYFENLDTGKYYQLDEERKSIHQRLMIELSIGIVVLIIGISLILMSLQKRFQYGIR